MTDDQDDVGSSIVRVDVLDERVAGSSSVVRVLQVRDGIDGLEGHFPGSPVVPGVVQIQWVIHTARRLVGGMPSVGRFEGLKFKALIRPGQRVEVAASLSESGDSIQFRISCGKTIFSSGRCMLRSAVRLDP
jgi:3-hydroxymyristoyl/3-hydroxydecanoyl-(acyl carrier protein) dehydratase